MTAERTTSALPSVSPSTSPTVDARVVRFSGSCAIANAEAIRDRLVEALQDSTRRRLVIDCDDVDDVDLTFIQLLLATHKSGEEAGHSVALSRPAGGPLAEALVSAGFAHPDGAHYGWLNPFWAGA